MLKLRKVLLSNHLYLIILIFVVIISILRLSIARNSIYKSSQKKFILTITNYSIDEDKLTLYLKNKELLIGTYYFKTQKEKEYFKNNIKLGDKLKLIGTITTPNQNTSNNLFNYKEYLYNKNVYYLLNIKKYKKIADNKNIFFYIKNTIRNRMKNRYLYTFILGDKSYLSSEVITSYQENGISHLFAISGMHISLLSGLILNALKIIKLNEEKRYYITVLFLLLYLLIADISPSIIRGVLFFILFGINNIYYFYIKPYNLFILSLSITLIINPFYIYDIGFQYSFLISITLLLNSKFLESKNYFISLLKVSIISSIISIPIQLKNFYQINILSILNNLLFVPLISLIVFPLSILVLIIPPLEIIYNPLTSLLERISIIISHINTFKIAFIKLPNCYYVLYLIIIIIGLYLYLEKQNKKIIIFILLILIIHSNYNFIIKNKYIYYIDVGQGDSTLIHINNINILIDTGGKIKYDNYLFNKRIKDSSIAKNTTIPILKSLGINKINYLVITHGDFDHMGEAINLVNNFKVEKVIFNCGSYNDLEKQLIKDLDEKHIKYYSCIKKLNIDKNKLYFLQTKEYDNENDNSNVIYTELDGYIFMFMGDASTITEKEILNKYDLPDIDVLKVGHHGSKTSSGKEFINEINPKYSIISVGKNNRYGHPNKEVLNNLKDSKIYRTDQAGSIMFKIKNNKLKIETCTP